MKTSLKLSIATLLLSSMAMGTAMAAGTTAPTLRADKLTATIGSPATVNVLANDRKSKSTITNVVGNRAKYGTVSCVLAGQGACTYTANPAQAGKRKADSFTYTVTYTDSKGKPRTRSSTVSVRLVAAPVSPAA